MTTHPYSTLSALFPMSQDELHEIAQATTPASVDVPNTWPSLAVWALSKWGIGIVFCAFLVPVYQDLKESNQSMVRISVANIQAMNALAEKIEAGTQQTRINGEKIDSLERRSYQLPK